MRLGNSIVISINISLGQDFKTRVTQAILDWLPLVEGAAGNLLKSLQKKSAQWWYFLEDPYVPPDNRAERNLRLAATKRKVRGSVPWMG
jgi:transposase